MTVPPVLVRLPDEDKETVPIVPAPAARLPLMFNVPAPTVSPKVEPPPADEAFKVTAAAVSLTKLTLPVELALRVAAFIVLAPPNEIPAVPAVRFAVAALSEPAAVIPLPAAVALRLKEEPELAFKTIAAAFVSTIFTTPVELAVSVAALIEPVPLIVIPPVPAESTRVGVVSVLVDETAPVAPGVAVSEIEFEALSADVRATLPAVEVSEILLAVIVPKLALVIPALAVRPTVVPVMAPLSDRAAALEVRLTVVALMVPAAELVRLPAVVPTVKLVAAPEAPDIFVAAPLVMLTSCPAPLALALMLAAATVRAVPPVPMLPAVDVRFKVGVVIVPKLALVMPPFDVSDTDVVAVIAPASASELVLAVRLTICALIVPAAELVKLPPLFATVKLVPAPDAPVILSTPPLVEILTN